MRTSFSQTAEICRVIMNNLIIHFKWLNYLNLIVLLSKQGYIFNIYTDKSSSQPGNVRGIIVISDGKGELT